jgi:sterol desaturase/sphingolipid hydroxylase (fatty acid hydroxylase superfamily)
MLISYLLQQCAIFLSLFFVFGALGLLVRRPLRWPRAGWGTDLTFLLSQGMFNRAAVALAVLVAARISGIQASIGSGSAWPIWEQTLVVLLAWEFVIYWQHRLLHAHLWPLHAVHHSSVDLDWLSTYRMHPLEVMFYFAAMAIILALGFSPQCFVWISLFRLIHNSLIHSDLPWTLGPLRYVVTSPIVHRWHHEVSPESIDTNFASALAVYDVLFGTFYCPSDRLPSRFGIPDEIPAGFARQLVYPFQRLYAWRNSE